MLELGHAASCLALARNHSTTPPVVTEIVPQAATYLLEGYSRSPRLSVGGASMGDTYSLLKLRIF